MASAILKTLRGSDACDNVLPLTVTESVSAKMVRPDV